MEAVSDTLLGNPLRLLSQFTLHRFPLNLQRFCGAQVCVLSATGTAVILDMVALNAPHPNGPSAEDSTSGSGGVGDHFRRAEGRRRCCSMWHIPYSHKSPPFSMRLVLCNSCGRRYVPDVLLTTLELPPHAQIQGHAQLLEVISPPLTLS